jgi:hypothetical protein
VAIYKEGPQFEVVALDSSGRLQPQWAAAFRERPFSGRPITDDRRADRRHWMAIAQRLGARLDPARRPHALASIVVRPAAI